MVSVGEKRDVTYKTAMFKFFALSTDTKPTETYGGCAILNGSFLMEIDTGKEFLYDEEGKSWEEQP